MKTIWTLKLKTETRVVSMFHVVSSLLSGLKKSDFDANIVLAPSTPMKRIFTQKQKYGQS